MGSAISCAPPDVNSSIQEVLQYVQEDIADQLKSLVDIPKSFASEHIRIVGKMEEAAPKSYQNLLYSEYPDKNLSEVNNLALKEVTSNTVKQAISDKIYKAVEPKIDEKLADKPAPVQDLIKKGIKKSIDKSVDKAIDEGVKKIDLSKKPEEKGK